MKQHNERAHISAVVLAIFMAAATAWAAGVLWVINQLFGAPPVSLPWALFGGGVFTLAAGLSGYNSKDK